jgi:hypothetical protein
MTPPRYARARRGAWQMLPQLRIGLRRKRRRIGDEQYYWLDLILPRFPFKVDFRHNFEELIE